MNRISNRTTFLQKRSSNSGKDQYSSWSSILHFAYMKPCFSQEKRSHCKSCMLIRKTVNQLDENKIKKLSQCQCRTKKYDYCHGELIRWRLLCRQLWFNIHNIYFKAVCSKLYFADHQRTWQDDAHHSFSNHRNGQAFLVNKTDPQLAL